MAIRFTGPAGVLISAEMAGNFDDGPLDWGAPKS